MDRRQWMAGASGLFLTGAFTRSAWARSDDRGAASDVCEPTLPLTPGPFLTESPLRSDIREDRQGAPLDLRLKILDQDACDPIRGALVEVWQCDAQGVYSNVRNFSFGPGRRGAAPPPDTRGQTFLRGHQITDENGEVAFKTIIPSWYSGRIPHIHVKTVGGKRASHSTQLFLPSDVEQAVFATGIYAERGQTPVSIERDGVVRGDRRMVEALTLDMKRLTDGFDGRFTITMDGA